MEKDAEESKMPFRPNISVMSQRIIAGKTKDKFGSTHDMLYNDARRRKEQKKEEIPNGFSFSPNLTKLDPNLFKGVEKPSGKNKEM